MTLIEKAQKFAHEAHDSIGQVRKYTGEPYWVHTDAVAALVSQVTTNEDVIAAAHLHDVIEDVFPLNSKYSIEVIRDTFGWAVMDMVIDLTDKYTKENYPKMNRETRKQHERERISITPPNSKTIKLADLINNTDSIVNHDRDFAMVYIREKMALLPYLTEGHPALLNQASMQVLQACIALGIEIPVIT